MTDRKPCPKKATVTCGLGKGHSGDCAPYPTKPQEIPSLVKEADFLRGEITFIPESGQTLKTEDWDGMMYKVQEMMYEAIGTRLLVEGRINIVVNGKILP